MKRMLTILLALFLSSHATFVLTSAAPQDAAKNIQPSSDTAQTAIAGLRNQDVLEMVKAQLEPATIIAKIKSAGGTFDTSPAALDQLKTERVPDAVILAMVLAPKMEAPAKVAVPVPANTLIELETAYDISSQEVREGEAISFRVVNPVKVGDAMVIAPGATATGRVVKASRGGHFGRAGRLAWSMIEVTAVDGTRLPIQFSGRIVGDSKGAKVATQTIITGALLWPIAPIALLNGFKRGGNALIPRGKRFEVFTRYGGTVSVAASR